MRLTLRARTLLPSPSPLNGAFYVRRRGAEMMTFAARSRDHGRTWTPDTPRPDFSAGLPAAFRRVPYPGFVDPVNGRLLVVVFALDRPDVDPKTHEPEETATDSYIRYRVSTDGGRTFLFDEPVVQKGPYDLRHPLDGLWLGKNAIFLGDTGCRPIRTRAGKVLVPAQRTILGKDGRLETFGSGWDYYESLLLIGSWRRDGRLDWEISAPIAGDPARTVRGLYEPTLAEMPGGRILCLLRGSNGLKKDPLWKLPGVKWRCVSDDGGRTFTTPEPWTYADGGALHSPSSMSQLIRHSSGRYLWLGNVTPDNPHDNLPCWPLVIGEVDPKTLGLVRESVLTLDTRRPGEPEALQLSNFYAFEDRATREIVLPMTRWLGSDAKVERVVYRIAVDSRTMREPS